VTPSLPKFAAAGPADLLAGLEQPARDAIVAGGRIRRIPAKGEIITAGHRATHVFQIQSGQVRYYHLTKQGDLVQLAWMVPGDVLGLAAMLEGPSAYMASAEAISDCELLTWEQSTMRKLVSLHPLLGENGLRIALGYLRNYIDRHVGLLTKTAEARLAETLFRLSDRSGEVHPGGIEIHATNEQLSALADISRFTTSRVLSNWVRSGTVSKGRGRLVLHNPEALMID
jgi:CRP/FNR family transcriptional regulator, nitrogen oxide reductase regulator